MKPRIHVITLAVADLDRALAFYREDVHRPGAQRGDQPVQVVRVLVRRGHQGAIGTLAAP